MGSVCSTVLPPELEHLQSRNNQLSWLGLQQDGMLHAIENLKLKLGTDRIGIVMGTSTSSIGRTEEGYLAKKMAAYMPQSFQQPEVHNLHSSGIFTALATGINGPMLTISTACSSSAKAYATAKRWISYGLVDAVLVAGVDSLCLSVMYGFNSLELLSTTPCRPFDHCRDGISIGEAACFTLLTSEKAAPDAELEFLGYGESSDAYHMSHPHPEGKGALLAIDDALKRAQVTSGDIDYINLHGTASKANDLIENIVLSQRFPKSTLASSTKGWTGHTLGTAGILESIISCEVIRHGEIPGTLNCKNVDPAFQFPIQVENSRKSVNRVMSNSFGFGGNNAALIFGRRHD